MLVNLPTSIYNLWQGILKLQRDFLWSNFQNIDKYVSNSSHFVWVLHNYVLNLPLIWLCWFEIPPSLKSLIRGRGCSKILILKKMTYMYNTCIRHVSLYLLYNAIKCQEIELATLVFLFFLHDFRHQSHCMHRHVQYPWTSSYIPWWTLGLNQIVRIDLYIRVIFASQSVFVIFHLNKLNMETGNINGQRLSLL